jgi:hypothetical protein
LEFLESLFDQVLEDITREDFSVPDKYKLKQEELSKKVSQLFLLLSFLLPLSYFPSDRNLNYIRHPWFIISQGFTALSI